MPGIFSLSRRVLGAAATLTLGATLTATTAPAATAATTAPAGAVTAPVSPTQTRGEQFYCDLSGYGGGATADQTISFTEPSVVAAGQPLATKVSIPAVPLTAAESTQLATADRYTLSVSFTATDTTASTDDTGSAPAAASPAAIPALTGTGSVTFRAAGHAYINDIAGFTITPSAGGTAMAPITCYNAVPVLSNWNVTVTAPGVPLYQCVDSTSAQPSWLWSLPMKITASGPAAVDGTERVTMTSGDTNFGPPYPAGTLGAKLTGSLPVTGAQPGAIQLRGQTSATSSDPFTLSGTLKLTRAGTDVIHDASSFAFTAGSVTFACELAGDSAPAGLTLTVASASPSPSPSATSPGAGSSTGGSPAATAAVPVGAPNTGGGPRPGSDLPLAAAGLALLLLGGGAVWYAARRRALR